MGVAVVSIGVVQWPSVWKGSCSLSLLCVAFVNVIHFVCASFPFGFEMGYGFCLY